MSALEVFSSEGWSVRAGIDAGEPWFVASDVAKALGYRDAEKLARRLDEDERGTRSVGTPGGQQTVTTITEAGLYNAVLGSQLAEAKAFKRWITHEVLPAIRRTGLYTHPSKMPTHSEALRGWANEIERADALAAELEVAAPKADAYDAFLDADGFFTMEATAKALRVGRNTFFRLCRQYDVLTKDNLPFQRYAHHFHVALGTRTTREGATVPTHTTRVKPSGVEFLRRRLGLTSAQLELLPGGGR